MIFITTMIESMLVLVLLAIPLIVTQLVRRRRRIQAHPPKAEIGNAVEAKAVILNIEQTGLLVNKKPQVKLQMQVIPDRGRNFIVELSDVETAFDLQKMRSGSLVKVKYNPNDMRDITLMK